MPASYENVKPGDLVFFKESSEVLYLVLEVEASSLELWDLRGCFKFWTGWENFGRSGNHLGWFNRYNGQFTPYPGPMMGIVSL